MRFEGLREKRRREGRGREREKSTGRKFKCFRLLRRRRRPRSRKAAAGAPRSRLCSRQQKRRLQTGALVRQRLPCPPRRRRRSPRWTRQRASASASASASAKRLLRRRQRARARCGGCSRRPAGTAPRSRAPPSTPRPCSRGSRRCTLTTWRRSARGATPSCTRCAFILLSFFLLGARRKKLGCKTTSGAKPNLGRN